ncbi:glycoside hydrolase family 43 protein [Athelia psychrophila]|uniref:Glycoside hydrolase family 43 protein n=1 Tax=Athelia psychrophila TaxID=1759441 RepID=A0A166IL08_9AGAM|nr:glycoside hydrolase family 43 protein [Fibularhizoctonia sp. CBS 109695]
MYTCITIHFQSSAWYQHGIYGAPRSEALTPEAVKATSGPVFSSANGKPDTENSTVDFMVPSGDEIWLVYHYSTTFAVVCDGTRRTAVQPITFSSGEPVFGTPDALTTELAEPV